MLTDRRIKWSLIFGCWTILGLLSAVRIKVSYAYSSFPISWMRALALAMADWYAWAALFPVMLWLVKRFSFERRNWRRSLLVHLPAGVVLSDVKLLIEVWLTQAIVGVRARTVQITQFSSTLFTYYAILGVVFAVSYYRRAREHELQAAQLASQLAEAQLSALRMQLHPHFLFNTLHAVSSLMRKDVEAADGMIVRLGDLLRLTLEETGAEETSLRREMELLERYLEIEQIRFRDRLQARIEVEPETLDARVPGLILQPLVENAIRHGISPRAAPGQITIRAWREGGRLRLEVSDNGVGLTTAQLAALKEGVGLGNTRARLRQLYGENHSFELRSGGGFTARLSLPFHVE